MNKNNILQRIVDVKRREVAAMMKRFPPDYIHQLADDSAPSRLSMSKSIRNGSGIIAEFKRRSPSKGEIAPMADVTAVASIYAANGASAISVLTDTAFFGGSDADLAQARYTAQDTPIIRKEFIVDSYQIDIARILGADAILLIAAVLEYDDASRLNDYAHDLGLEVLLELHNRREIEDYSGIEADMLGINNRDLTSFATDCNVSAELCASLPRNKVRIAESGMHVPADVARLRDTGFDGFLIGEALMKSSDPAKTLKAFANING